MHYIESLTVNIYNILHAGLLDLSVGSFLLGSVKRMVASKREPVFFNSPLNLHNIIIYPAVFCQLYSEEPNQGLHTFCFIITTINNTC